MSKISVIDSVSKDELQSIVDRSSSLTEVLGYFGLSSKGTGNFNTLRRKLQTNGINWSGLQKRQKEVLKRHLAKISERNVPSLDSVLIKGSTYSRSSLKKRLIQNGLLEEVCGVCGTGPIWQSRKLVLQLDHINGVYNDNRLENLRLLCPNCHSQTDSFSGLKTPRYKKSLEDPEWRRRPRPERRKVKERPSREVLEAQIKELGYCATGRLYGVSDNAIRKWLVL